MINKYLVLLFSGLLLLASCEDVITVETEPAISQLVVDAWIDNRPQDQLIRLTKSSAYFDSAPSPAVTGAEVVVVDENGDFFEFEDQGDGNYVWASENGETLGTVGTFFGLNIDYNGFNYQSFSELRRVMEIDSISYEFREAEFDSPEGYYAELFARDFEGEGDLYWIKAWKNGEFLNAPDEMNMAWDAAFTASSADGVYFITPIRELINPFGLEDENGEDLPPYSIGDSIYVEVHSLNEASFYWLFDAQIQMTNGENGIFASPVTNVLTNIISPEGVSKENEAVGMFNVAAVSSLGVKVEE